MPSLATLVSVVLVLSCGQTDRITDDRYTHATTVNVIYTLCPEKSGPRTFVNNNFKS